MKFTCLLCGKIVDVEEVENHKKIFHSDYKHYGIMWPKSCSCQPWVKRSLRYIPTFESSFLAEQIGVDKVYIRDEGSNPSGSMKDYLVERAIREGVSRGYRIFTVTSSGNHAFSLSFYTKRFDVTSIIFMPATSSKLRFSLSADSLVIGVKDAIFEEVYKLSSKISLAGVYNANVNNELLLEGVSAVSEQLKERGEPLPTHILAGVGNGTYLAGIVLGFEKLGTEIPKIVPVGMKGAFPLEAAMKEKKLISEYEKFLFGEKLVSAAEGSIAIASYSMPQLVHALELSRGFVLGELTNRDLREAYLCLNREDRLKKIGVIPEPTGIMGLAAALKYRHVFRRNDCLLICFTGTAQKDKEGVKRLAPEIDMGCLENNPLLKAEEYSPVSCPKKPLLVEKDIAPEVLKEMIVESLHLRQER